MTAGNFEAQRRDLESAPELRANPHNHPHNLDARLKSQHFKVFF
jgi:hypothetical protein